MRDLDRRSAIKLVAATAAGATIGVHAADPKPLKVGFMYLGPIGDMGWTFSHDMGRKKVEEAFGSRVETVHVQNVPEGPDAERVARDLINQGCKLIFGTTFGYQNPFNKVAREHPDVMFEHCTGYKTLPNLRTYDTRAYQATFLAGVVAGAMTKTNAIGYVATVPIPDQLRNLNSFALGAQFSNPGISTRVIWLNEWHNPPKEVEATTTLINQGADIILQNTNSPTVLKTADQMGKRAFGRGAVDMGEHGPKAHIATLIYDWSPYYIHAVREVLDGTWKTGPNQWWGVKEGATDLIAYAVDVPESTRNQVESIKAGMRDDSFSIWKGPIKNNKGEEVLAGSVIADDDFLRNMQFYVEGIEGKVPGT